MPDDATNGNQMSQVLRKLNDIQEALDGKGREPGMRQELREMRMQLDGRPPKYQDGLVYAITLLGENHTALRREFDEHVDTQNNEASNRQGRWKGAYTVYAVLGGVLFILGTIIALFVSLRQALAPLIGGG